MAFSGVRSSASEGTRDKRFCHARKLTRWPSGPHAFVSSSAWERSGADMDEDGEPEAEEATLAAGSVPVLARLWRWCGSPEVIRTRERNRTRGLRGVTGDTSFDGGTIVRMGSSI